MDNTIKIVIGSWGSYNECNKKALGSKWIDLSDYFDRENYGRMMFGNISTKNGCLTPTEKLKK